MTWRVLDRAVALVRSAASLPSHRPEPPIARDPAEALADARLLEFVADDLRDRVQALRAAIREVEDGAAPPPAAIARCLDELNLLDDLGSSVADLVIQTREARPVEPVDLVDPFRRALRRLEERRGLWIPVRVRTSPGSPRVLANPSALVRTLSLCLEASALARDASSSIVVDVQASSGTVAATFRPESTQPAPLPKSGERLRSILALATRLASTFDATLDVERCGVHLLPRLRLRAEMAL